eukprot:comp137319_c0_seq1/m.49219 comp137319_c0_seq1/g.49219  ORF comp137319_c0_seq1/g.49219 comp137319_c0_seq1/m.49219 type:complete len:143 (-) comp137319_c0_seq1:102-530(-)
MSGVVTGVTVSPNDCALTAPLTLCIQYCLHAPLACGVWVFDCVADVAHLKKKVPLGQVGLANVDAGEHEVTLSLPTLALGHLPPSALHNVAMITCRLADGQTHSTVLEVPLVMHVNVDEDAVEAAHVRRIFYHPGDAPLLAL